MLELHWFYGKHNLLPRLTLLPGAPTLGNQHAVGKGLRTYVHTPLSTHWAQLDTILLSVLYSLIL